MDVDEDLLWQQLCIHSNQAARSTLIALHLPYARIVAARLYAVRRHDAVEFNDYLQMASVALLESLDRYDPQRGARFRTFALHRMFGAIRSGLERQTEIQQQISAQQRLRSERLSLSQEVARPTLADAGQLFSYLAEVGIGLALGAVLDGAPGLIDLGQNVPDQHYERLELKQFTRRLVYLIEQLSARERQVIQRHYLQGLRFDEIASQLDISRSRVSQLHYQGLAHLRLLLAKPDQLSVRW
jgi:RNA polymerase sigma factor for flagellar operon FliA